jgi:hypothetical protein
MQRIARRVRREFDFHRPPGIASIVNTLDSGMSSRKIKYVAPAKAGD